MEHNNRTPRLDIQSVSPQVFAHMVGFRRLLDESGLDTELRDLIKVRASQINKCLLCLDMHIREAREHGISDDKLHLLVVWREAPGFSEAERAALALTEAVTLVSEAGVTNTLYEEVRKFYSEEQYVGLLTTIVAINGWNRLMIGVGAVPPTR